MLKSKAALVARNEMKAGNNCCQAILLAASQVWDIPLGEDTLVAASFFGRGMESGCVCGALIGMVMAAGIMEKYHPHPAGAKMPQHLHDQFKMEFGSTCCRVIRKKHSVIQNIGNRACLGITSKAAQILVAEWEGIMGCSSNPSSRS